MFHETDKDWLNQNGTIDDESIPETPNLNPEPINILLNQIRELVKEAQSQQFWSLIEKFQGDLADLVFSLKADIDGFGDQFSPDERLKIKTRAVIGKCMVPMGSSVCGANVTLTPPYQDISEPADDTDWCPAGPDSVDPVTGFDRQQAEIDFLKAELALRNPTRENFLALLDDKEEYE